MTENAKPSESVGDEGTSKVLKTDPPLANGLDGKEEVSSESKIDLSQDEETGQIKDVCKSPEVSVRRKSLDKGKDSAGRRPSLGRRRSQSKSTDEEVKAEKVDEAMEVDGDEVSDGKDRLSRSEEPAEVNPKEQEAEDQEDFKGFSEEVTQHYYSDFSKKLDNFVKGNLAKRPDSVEMRLENGSMNPVVHLKPLSPRLSSAVKKKSHTPRNFDITNPMFKKPFEFGWIRELVYRNTNDSSFKRNADVYYYTPSNKKVRSLREISDHLMEGELTLENFTFFKEPIGVNDPNKEIIREAKNKSGIYSSNKMVEPLVVLQERVTPLKKTPKAPKKSSSRGSSPSSPPPTIESSLPTPRVVFKPHIPPKKSNASKKFNLKGEKKRKSAGPDDSDMNLSPSEWSPPPVKQQSNGMKRGSSESDGSVPEKMAKNTSPKVKSLPSPLKHGPSHFMMNLNAGYTALLHAFQYLKVHELLRASCVCKMWRHMASHRSLWETVKMKNSRVRDWEGFGKALQSNGTKSLDLKKMLLPESCEATMDMWRKLAESLSGVTTLRKIDLGRCVPEALHLITAACPQLESIIALTIRGQSLDASCFENMKNLEELKLKSVGGFDITNLDALKSLKKLKHLALTTVKNLNGIEEVVKCCEGLVSLELGECGMLNTELATEALPRLTNLTRLRLEKGQGSSCPTIEMIEAISGLSCLSQLELINFDIKPGFDKALAKCVHLRTLLIIPTYVTQSATTNHVVMGGVSKLSNTLTYFIWGLTLELLRVTDLFIDQVENQSKGGKAPAVSPAPAAKKGTGDSIPILKPLQSESIDSTKESQTSQVDILALPKLQKVLSTLLPTTKIKILKVPFSATWRQTVDL